MAAQRPSSVRSAGALAAFALSAVLAAPAQGADGDFPVRSVVGVRVQQAPNEVSEGMGVHIGNGRVWTVAHVLGDGEIGAPVTVVAVDGNGYYGRRLVGTVEALDPVLDSAIVRVADFAGLLPLAPCRAPQAGDQVSIARLNEVGDVDERLVPGTLEIEDRVFARLRGIAAPAIPGGIGRGFSGSPILDGTGRCFYGLASGTLSATKSDNGRLRRLDFVVVIEPSALARLRRR